MARRGFGDLVCLWREEVPADSVAALTGPRFWHYQFAKTGEARRWLTLFADRPWERLTWGDIERVLQEEGGDTALLKCDSASGESGGAPVGHQGWWRSVTPLAEVFNYRCRLCSCHFLCTFHLRQPIFLAKRNPPESPSPDRKKLQNAKELHFHERGRRGHPCHPRGIW